MVTRDQIKDDYIVAIARQIDALDDFLPTMNPYCVYCSYRNDCSPYKEALNGDGADSPEAMGRQYLALKKHVEALRRGLKAIISSSGPVLVGDREITLQENISSSYPLDGLIEALEGLEVSLPSKSTVSATAVKDILKAHREALRVQGKGICEVEQAIGEIEAKLEEMKITRSYTKMVERTHKSLG